MALTNEDIETIQALIERRFREELGPRPDPPGSEMHGSRGTVWDALRDLAEAQGRTEKRVEELAQAQGRTEKRVEELARGLAEMQRSLSEMQAAMGEMQRAIGALARQVGGLSETVGGDIEDIAYIVLHDVLMREFGWKVGVLERSWQEWGGEPEEVDIFGQASDPKDPAKEIWVVGEAKHNLTVKQVERFARKVVRARTHISGASIFPVCFCYRARPEVQAAVKEAGLRMVYSYGKLV